MNPFAGLMAPMLDRPCVERREKRGPRAGVPQWPPRRELPVIVNPWKLSPMQCAVMEMAVRRMGKKAIGEKLGINPKTVDSHPERILTKMDVATKPHAQDLWDRWSREHQETKAEAVLFDGTAPGGDLQVSGA